MKDKYGQELVPCKYCGTPTSMTGTKLCDPCWEAEKGICHLKVEDLKKILEEKGWIIINKDEKLNVNDFSERLKAHFSGEFVGGHYDTIDGGCPTCGYGGTKAMSLETIRDVIDEFIKDYIKKENKKSGNSKGNS